MIPLSDISTVLIVDDMPANLGLVVNLLEERGYRVVIAEDGEEGLQRAELVLPDLILLDVMMPAMDGFEVCRRLKAQEKTRDIPVIFLTALNSTEQKVKGFEAGGVDYVTKPIAADELLARVQTHVTISRLERGLKDANRTLEESVAARTAELSAANAALRQEVAERKQAEEKLQLLNENLEQRVQEETAKNMAQERLLIQQSRLAAMGEMIHNIAHQWRQPINALILLLGNIQEDFKFNELTAESLDRDVKLGQSMIHGMSTTIDDFRNFFKPNKEKEQFFVNASVESAIRMIFDSFVAHNINISQKSEGEPCEVCGYPNEFAQVVLNVLTNSKESILSRNITGEVCVAIKSDENAAIVSIRDNGGGIPEEFLPKVFDPYFTTKVNGTGIGLYMSKMIMDNMGGDIAIRNVEGGVEALLTLPCATSRSTR